MATPPTTDPERPRLERPFAPTAPSVVDAPVDRRSPTAPERRSRPPELHDDGPASHQRRDPDPVDNAESPDLLDRREQERRSRERRRFGRKSALLLTPATPFTPKEGPRPDRLAPYQRIIVAARWASLAVSGVSVATATHTSNRVIAALAFFVVLAWLRSVRPIRHRGFELRAATAIVVELAITITLVTLTGGWQSPLVYMLLPPILVGTVSQDSPLAIGYGSITALIMSSLDVGRAHEPSAWRSSAQWSIQLFVFAAIATLGRRILHDAFTRHENAMEGMRQLTNANGLLFALHKVAQSLPSSLDLEDVAASTIANARELFPSEAITILVRDEAHGSWEVLRSEGVRLPRALAPSQLPPPIAGASRSMVPIRLCELPATQRITLLVGARSGIYVPLRARGTSFGVLAIEHGDQGFDDTHYADLARRFADPASIAIDNARWFGRIRRVAADEERVRIARDLHDRIGQSLAYLGFELDRLAMHPEVGALKDDVTRLRSDVRTVVSEVRETLYDIRTDVHDDHSATATLEHFLERVGARNPGLRISFSNEATLSLPARQEREMWMIAKEAIINVERHAEASELSVRWTTTLLGGACVEVRDNGRGFDGRSGRVDSYGLRGLHERANAIGARLEIRSAPRQGTTVTCRLD